MNLELGEFKADIFISWLLSSRYYTRHLGHKAENNLINKELNIAGNYKSENNYSLMGYVLNPVACTNARGTEMKTANSLRASWRKWLWNGSRRMNRSSLVRAWKDIPGRGMVGAKAQRHERTWHVWELVKTVGVTDVWGAEWAVGGEELWRAGWEGDCEGLNRLNHTVWTVGNEEAWDLLSRRGHDQIKEILPCTHYGIQPGKGAGSKRGRLRLQEPLGEDDD